MTQFTLVDCERWSCILETADPDLYARLSTEIRRAAATHKPPEGVWPSLYALIPETETFELAKAYIPIMVFDFFMVSDDSEVSFFVDVFKHYESFRKQRLSNDVPPSEAKTDSFDEGIILPFKTDLRIRFRVLFSRIERRVARFQYAERLCKIAAILVREKIVEFNDLWSHMGGDSSLADYDSKYAECIGKVVREVRNGRATTAVDAHVNDQTPSSAGDTIRRLEKAFDTVFQNDTKFRCPLKVYFLAALLNEGAACYAIFYLNVYKNLALSCQSLRHSLMTYLQLTFETSAEENRLHFLRYVGQMLGPYLGDSLDFFTQACKLCVSKYNSNKSMVFKVLCETILPSVSRHKFNEDAVDSVSTIFVKMKLSRRFHIFAQWSKQCERIIVLKLFNVTTENDVKTLMEELTKDSVDSAGKSIALRANTNPLLVWKEVISYMYKVDSVIPAVVDSVASFSKPLAQDALLYTIIDMTRDLSKDIFDRKCVESRLLLLSKFAAMLFRQSTYLQGEPLVVYLKFLAERDFASVYDLIALSDVLRCMSGIEPLFLPSEAKMRALGGSKLLRKEIFLPTTVDDVQELAVVKKEVSEYCETFDCDPVKVTIPDPSPFGAFQAPVRCLVAALRYKSYCRNALTKLVYRHTMNDNFEEKTSTRFNYRDWKSSLVDQILNIVSFCDKDALDLLPETSTLRWSCDTDQAIYMKIHRALLRSYVVSKPFDFVGHIRSLFTNRVPNGVNRNFYALFWTLEAYDICVPESDYASETLRIESLSHSGFSVLAFDASQSRIIKSLNARKERHVAHVAWVSSRLPKFKLNKSFIEGVLHSAVIPRMLRSLADAQYVLRFLALTLVDPIPLLDALFKRKALLKLLPELSELESRVLAYVTKEIQHEAKRSVFSGTRGDKNAAQSMQDGKERNNQGQQVSSTNGVEDPKHSLFRDCKDIESHLKRWEENVTDAVTLTLERESVCVPQKKTVLGLLHHLSEHLHEKYSKGQGHWHSYEEQLQKDERSENEAVSRGEYRSEDDGAGGVSRKRGHEQEDTVSKRQRVDKESVGDE